MLWMLAGWVIPEPGHDGDGRGEWHWHWQLQDWGHDPGPVAYVPETAVVRSTWCHSKIT